LIVFEILEADGEDVRARPLLERRRVRPRYVAERHEIATRYAEWEIIGPPEIRDVDPRAISRHGRWRRTQS